MTTLNLLDPTKLYLPMVWAAATLSKRKESFERDLRVVSTNKKKGTTHDCYHPFESFKYAAEGVRRAPEIQAHKGTRLGGFARF